MPASMLDRASWLNYIKTSLGYPVVNIYMTDEMIEQQITFAIRKVLPYVNAVEFIEVGRKTEFTDRLIYAVLRVHQMGWGDAEACLIRGQTFNDGEWCYITGLETNTSPTSPTLYMSIRWDNEFNGTKTFLLP